MSTTPSHEEDNNIVKKLLKYAKKASKLKTVDHSVREMACSMIGTKQTLKKLGYDTAKEEFESLEKRIIDVHKEIIANNFIILNAKNRLYLNHEKLKAMTEKRRKLKEDLENGSGKGMIRPRETDLAKLSKIVYNNLKEFHEFITPLAKTFEYLEEWYHTDLSSIEKIVKLINDVKGEKDFIENVKRSNVTKELVDYIDQIVIHVADLMFVRHRGKETEIFYTYREFRLHFLNGEEWENYKDDGRTKSGYNGKMNQSDIMYMFGKLFDDLLTSKEIMLNEMLKEMFKETQ